MTDSTDRTLLILFVLIALLAFVVYFSPRMMTVRPVSRTNWYSTSAPASAGTVVRGISPVSSSRSSYSYSDTSSSYSSTSTPTTTTTTTYHNY